MTTARNRATTTGLVVGLVAVLIYWHGTVDAAHLALMVGVIAGCTLAGWLRGSAVDARRRTYRIAEPRSNVRRAA